MYRSPFCVYLRSVDVRRMRMSTSRSFAQLSGVLPRLLDISRKTPSSSKPKRVATLRKDDYAICMMRDGCFRDACCADGLIYLASVSPYATQRPVNVVGLFADCAGDRLYRKVF